MNVSRVNRDFRLSGEYRSPVVQSYEYYKTSTCSAPFNGASLMIFTAFTNSESLFI